MDTQNSQSNTLIKAGLIAGVSFILGLFLNYFFYEKIPGVSFLLYIVLVIVGFSQKEIDSFMKPWIAWLFIGLLVVIFLWSAIVVFNPFLGGYVSRFYNSERFYGGALLFIVALLASWILTRSVKK